MRRLALQWCGGMVFGGIVLAIFILSGFFDASMRILQPFSEKPLTSLSSGIRNATTAVRSLASRPSTFSEMQQRIAQLQTENNAYKYLEIENDSLRQQLAFKRRSPHTLVYAHVVGMSSESGTNLMIIDKGSYDGIKQGYAVTTGDGIYIGYIAHSTATVSYVILPNNDKSSVIASIIKEKTELSGIVRGSFRAGLVLDRVEQKIPLVQGDTIMTSSLNSTIPSGLLIGEVHEITSSPNDLFQQTTVTPTQNYDTVRNVGVIVNNRL